MLQQHTTTTTTLVPPLPEPERPGWLDWVIDSYLPFFEDPWGRIGPPIEHALRTAVLWAERYSVLLVVLALGLVALRWWFGSWQARRLTDGGAFLEVFTPPEATMDHAENLWMALHDALPRRWPTWLFGRPHVVWELHWSPGGQLRFGVWVPATVPPSAVQHAIEGAWPGTRTERHEPPPSPIDPDASVLGGSLRLAYPEWFPLKHDHRNDPLRTIISGAGELRSGETACVQILARPVTPRRLRRSEQRAATLKTGKGRHSILADLFDLIDPSTSTSTTAKPVPAGQDPARSQDVNEIVNKLRARPHWEIAIRYAVATTAPTTGLGGRRARAGLRDRAHGLAAAFGIYTGRNVLVRQRLARPVAALAARHMDGGSLVGLAELAALAHLPLDASVPGVLRAGAKALPPVPQVPTRGKVLGDAQAGPARPVALGVADSRHHVHVLGATGTGKSTVLANLILGDVAAGRGTVLIDPKGDLVRDVLDRLPEPPRGKLVIIDPEETAAPPSLNVLSGPNPELTVDWLVGIFRTVFSGMWGPRTDDLLRSGCLTLLHAGNRSGSNVATLADLPALFTEPGMRAGLVAKLPADGELARFWSWYERLGQNAQSAMLGPLLSRLRAFLLRPIVRDTIGTSASSFDLSKVLDGGLLLARLPKGILGEDTTRLLGSLLVAKTWQSVMHRARHGHQARRDSTLIVDEAHNFLTLPVGFEEMAAEARGFNLSLVLAHQNAAQLGTELFEGISSNARTKLWFSMSPEDARKLGRHVAPDLTEHDLSHLGAYQAAARLVVNGQEVPACTVATRPMPAAIPGRAEELREHARRATGRTREERQGDKRISDLPTRRGIAPTDLDGHGQRETP